MYELDGATEARHGDRAEARLEGVETRSEGDPAQGRSERDCAEKLLFKGELTAIGSGAEGRFQVRGYPKVTPDNKGAESELVSEVVQLEDHRAAITTMLDWLERNNETLVPKAIGHRIVHGGRDYVEPCLIDNSVIGRLEELSSLAPNHLPAALETLNAALECFPDARHVGCFDTAFHRAMPKVARVLPLPFRFFDEGVEKFGFHGLSYEYVLQEFDRVCGPQAAGGRLVIAHLGNGCSLAAVKERRCFDTTMGFSPTGGLVMGTRSGDLDPGLVNYLCEHRGLSTEEFSDLVNKRSGLVGLSGLTSDMRKLLAEEGNNEGARLALEIFCYHASKHICAMASAIGGIDTLIFTGGIGEHAEEIRRRICERLEFLGVKLGAAHPIAGGTVEISSLQAAVRTFVISTNEELIIARHTFELVKAST